MDRSKIIDYIAPYFSDTKYAYHSLRHSEQVADRAVKIAELENVSDTSKELLEIAALFHDVGYSVDIADHEQVSADIAAEYLLEEGRSEADISMVRDIIMATRMINTCSTIEQKIIKDADVGHIGQIDYEDHANLLRQEKAIVLDEHYDDMGWIKINQDFVKSYKWHTDGAKQLYNKQKKQHLEELKAKAKALKEKEKPTSSARGVETMYRVALRNHNQLSKIADNKANILLSITALMLSILISALAPKIDTNPNLVIPTVMIVIVCLVTMVYAILATRPKISSVKYSREKLLNNDINLLFFGNFYNIPVEEFEWGMSQLMNDKDLLYGSLTKDLYYLGSVLANKYKYLQIAYAIFMFGLIISSIGFIIVFSVGIN